MQKNDIITLKITDINNLGYGVGRHDGVVVFVAGAVSGDTVKAKIIKTNKNWCVGRLTEILERSPNRTDERFCAAPDSCGGCTYRNITYTHECELKREYVKNCFRKAGLFDVEVADVLTAGDIKGYRNKAQYPVKRENGRMRAGFYAAKTHNIVACESCALGPEIFSEIVRFVCDFADKNGITAYDELTGKGLLRHIYLREGQKTGEIMICLVINGKSLPCAEKFVAEVEARFENIKSIMLSVNMKSTNVVLGDEFICIGGKDYIEDILCDVRFRISAGSFYQVNREGAELLYTLAADLAEPEGKTVIDLYCGAGTIGLSMAKRAKRVVGIEIVDEAVRCANINAKINGIDNAEFYTGDASDTEGLLESVEKRSGEKIDADVVIMDPPRKGSTRELIEYLARRNITRVVYVSCDPDTLARDCKWFSELGYEIGKVTPVNMFPRTGHVESVVCITRHNELPLA
jgi:23S rRNA (uracil1939-C5)-methyltransferase